jgi:hypothetical protein
VILASKPLETRKASKREEPMRSNSAGEGHDRREHHRRVVAGVAAAGEQRFGHDGLAEVAASA